MCKKHALAKSLEACLTDKFALLRINLEVVLTGRMMSAVNDALSLLGVWGDSDTDGATDMTALLGCTLRLDLSYVAIL